MRSERRVVGSPAKCSAERPKMLFVCSHEPSKMLVKINAPVQPLKCSKNLKMLLFGGGLSNKILEPSQNLHREFENSFLIPLGRGRPPQLCYDVAATVYQITQYNFATWIIRVRRGHERWTALECAHAYVKQAVSQKFCFLTTTSYSTAITLADDARFIFSGFSLASLWLLSG